MATFFDGAIIGYWATTSTNYIYGKLTGDVSRSGNTVTLSNLYLTVWIRYSAYGSGSYTFKLNGTNTTWTMDAGSPSHSLNNTSLNVSTAQTSATIWWEGSDGYSGSFNISFPSGVTSPSGLSISIAEEYKDGAKFNVKVNDWGIGATSDRYFEAALMNHGSPYGSPYTYKHGTHGINAGVTEAITVTNNSKEPQSTITIVPNTQYYYGAWASNQSGAASINTMPGTLVTLADALDNKSAEAIDTHSIKISYTTKADGGKYAKKIQYSIDNSTWVDGATVSTGSATSGSFNITGLEAGTQYTIYLRISTSAGTTNSGSVSVTLQPDNKFYGSVNGKTKLVKKMYGSVNGKTKQITKIYGSVAGKTKRIF